MLRGGRRECCAGYPEGLHARQNTALDGCMAFAATSLKGALRTANLVDAFSLWKVWNFSLGS